RLPAGPPHGRPPGGGAGRAPPQRGRAQPGARAVRACGGRRRGRVHEGGRRARAARGHVLDGPHALARPGRHAHLDLELVDDGGGHRPLGGRDPAVCGSGEGRRRTEMTGTTTGTGTATGTLRLKTGLAEMLKGGVIMDVTDADQAKIAEDAGAVAVMALE